MVTIVPASAAVSEADSIMGLVQGVLPALPSALICAMGTCTEFGTPCTPRSRIICLVALAGHWGHGRCVEAANMCVVMQGKEWHGRRQIQWDHRCATNLRQAHVASRALCSANVSTASGQ